MTVRCKHEHIVDPPPGRHLRICLDCCKRLIECSYCDEKLEAGPGVADSDWTKGYVFRNGEVAWRWTTCLECQR